MLARNHAFQISDQADEPTQGVRPPTPQSERPLFWVLVVLLALACGVATFVLAPAPGPAVAPAPSAILAPAQKPASLRARGVTETGGPAPARPTAAQSSRI